MKLYDTERAPNPRRVRMFLAEKGVLDKVEIVSLDLGKGENLTPEFRAVNPMAKVPALALDDGNVITETATINRYLDEVFPSPSLCGETPLERAQIDMWDRRIELTGFFAIAFAFRHISGFFADRETVIKEWGEVNVKNAEKWFAFLDKHFAKNTYVVGDKFTVADITTVCAIDFAKVISLRISPEQTHLQRWYDEMRARPSYAA
jgi:glutathione S-transferase